MKKNCFIKNVINLIVVSISLNTCSCMLQESHKEGERSTLPSDAVQTSSQLIDTPSTETFYGSEISSSESEITSVENIESRESINRDNYIGIILENPQVLDPDSYSNMDVGYSSALDLGFDNDITRDELRKCFNDDSLNICDVSYFQDIPEMNEVHPACVFSEDINDPRIRTSLNIARYFLSENGFIFLTDEVPASFIKEEFPDFVAEYPMNGGFLFYPEDLSFYNYIDNIQENFSNNYEYSDDINIDRKCLYYSLQEYNSIRRSLMNQWGVRQERCLATINGQEIEINRLKYDADQYNRITEKLKEAYGYEISILEPETLENLKADGLNVENFEDFYNKVCGGTDFTYETYYSIKERVEGQRSRG